MKILFINAIDPLSEVQYRWPNLGLGYLAGAIRGHFTGMDIKIIDRDAPQEIKAFRPDIIGITAVSQNYNIAKEYARIAKLSGAFVIIGGMHISALPLTMTSDMDVAVIGEGEETIIEVIEHLFIPAKSTAKINEIKGIVWKINYGIFQNDPRLLINPIDQIKRPARDLLQIRKQSSLFSSRGCPYRCTFCFSSRYWKQVRFFSAEYVAEELREMASMGVKRVNFYDDLMIADLDRLIKLHDIIVRDPVLSRMKFWLNARANLVTDDTAEIMASMGVVSVGMGLESGNDRTLRYLKGGNVNVSDNGYAIHYLHKHGIAATASFIIGSPDETEPEIMDTYNFIEKSGLDFVDVFPLIPFPATPVWNEALSRGLVSNDMDWSRLNVYYTKRGPDPIIMSKHISRQRMDELYKMFQRQRLRIAMRRAWFHPFFKEMVKAGIRKGFNSLRKAL